MQIFLLTLFFIVLILGFIYVWMDIQQEPKKPKIQLPPTPEDVERRKRRLGI